jgi:predicted aspartyl protease
MTGNSVQVAGVDISGIQEDSSAFSFQFTGNMYSIIPQLVQAIELLCKMCSDSKEYSQQHSVVIDKGSSSYLTISKMDYNYISLSLNNSRILVCGSSYKFKVISTALKNALNKLESA